MTLTEKYVQLEGEARDWDLSLELDSEDEDGPLYNVLQRYRNGATRHWFSEPFPIKHLIYVFQGYLEGYDQCSKDCQIGLAISEGLSS